MDSRTHQNYQHQHHQNHPSNSGLLHFRSAPSSFLLNFTKPVIGGSDLSKCNPCEGSESQNFMSRYATCSDNTDSGSSSFHEFEEKPSPATFIEVPLKLVNPPLGLSGLPPHYPRHNPAVDSSYGKVTSMVMDHNTEGKRFSSQLIRQSSSPAGPFTDIPFQNGYNTVKGFGICNGAHGNIGEISPSMNELKSRTSFSSRTLSSLGVLSQISETVSESMHGTSSPEENENCETQLYGDGSTYGAWNDSSNFSDNFAGLKRQRSNEEKIFSSSQLVSHHLSLPKASAEMISVDKCLPSQDSVSWKIRAKRGCATHPRSIAERVRRTRISERMRKLQELVPKMDKQTNTADMLDLAVEYIKDLQKQFKTLRDNRAKCTC